MLFDANASLDQRRPECCELTSIAKLYSAFESLFLGSDQPLVSTCGHKITLFDHHFFHLASVQTRTETRLYMPEHKAVIQATKVGFGPYILGHGGSRARNLPSARTAMEAPDEVWINNPKATNSKWTYIREFDSRPYPFTIVLLTERPAEGKIIVPVSSFQCRRTDIKRWRQAERVYTKQVQPPEGG